MQHYKNYPIQTSAVSTRGVWQGRGIVLDPQANARKELQRIETVSDLLFLTKEEAEDFAFRLCKAWIDRSAPPSTM
ncbi:MAG: hypothetical protein ACM3TN_19730 [Alphaproteobacteria bacterium]